MREGVQKMTDAHSHMIFIFLKKDPIRRIGEVEKIEEKN